MANEPTLSEFTNIPADPERGTGQPAVVYDDREMVRNLNDNARFQAQNTWNKYINFNKQLSDTFANLQDASKLETMQEDKDYLRQQSADIFQKIASDPRGFLNGAKRAEIESDLRNLNSKATQSKQDNTNDLLHRHFMNTQPLLNTGINQKILDANRALPLGQRGIPKLDMPVIFDYDKTDSDLLKDATSIAEETAIVGSDGQPGEGYIQTTKRQKIDPEVYTKKWNQLYDFQTDQNQQSFKKLAEQQFQALPDNFKKQFKDSKDYWEWQGLQSIKGRAGTSVIDQKLIADPNYKAAERLQFDKQKEKDRNAIEWAKLKEDKRQFDEKQDQWKANQTGGESVKNGALSRANGIFNDLKGLADSEGFISPDKLRQLNVEQLKYLGIEAPIERDPETGRVLQSGGFRPLDLSGDNGVDAKGNAVQKTNYGIILSPSGDIRVMKNPHKDPNKTSGYVYGEFDPTKSTNLRNVATNILNEELHKAGSKELNSYLPIDLGDQGNVSENTVGGSNSVSGKSLATYKVGGTQYTHDQLNKLGYTDDQIKQAISLGNIKQ